MLASVACAPSRFSLRIAFRLRSDSIPFSVTRVPERSSSWRLVRPARIFQPFVGDHRVAQNQPAQILQPRKAFQALIGESRVTQIQAASLVHDARLRLVIRHCEQRKSFISVSAARCAKSAVREC